MFECDICSRPLSAPSHLKAHKISHMNDEERAAAEATGEIIGRRLANKMAWRGLFLKSRESSVKPKLKSALVLHYPGQKGKAALAAKETESDPKTKRSRFL